MANSVNDRQEIQEIINNLRPIDDEFFKYVAEDKAAIEEIIQVALNDEDIHVESCSAQEDVNVLGHRSITVDALCRSADGRIINVEAQVEHRNDDVRRVRLHLALLTVTNTPKGALFAEVPDVAVIYLADYDPLGKGELVYTVRRTIEGTNDAVDDGECAVFVNGTVRNEQTLSRIMQVLCDKKTVDYEVCPNLSSRKESIRNDTEVQEHMSKAFDALLERRAAESEAEGREKGREEGRKEGRKEGRAEGITEGRLAVVLDLYNSGTFTKEQAERWLGGLTLEQAREKVYGSKEYNLNE